MQPATPTLPPDFEQRLDNTRRALIAALNTLDDLAGRPRTVPSKDERRKALRATTQPE